jgi:uncharacterized protein (DUF433 family)
MSDPDDTLCVISHPLIRYGRPILQGSSVPVESVVGRFAVGEDIGALCQDYDLEPAQVLAMIRAVCAACYTRRGMRMPVHDALERAAVAEARRLGIRR